LFLITARGVPTLINSNLMIVFILQTSYRGRKALNLGGVVSPRAKQSKASNSPAPAAVPQQSPNTTSGLNHQQTNLQITAQQPQQSDTQQVNIQQIPSIAQTMKEQTPMVSFAKTIPR
jgi:hypothetical protein